MTPTKEIIGKTEHAWRTQSEFWTTSRTRRKEQAPPRYLLGQNPKQQVPLAVHGLQPEERKNPRRVSDRVRRTRTSINFLLLKVLCYQKTIKKQSRLRVQPAHRLQQVLVDGEAVGEGLEPRHLAHRLVGQRLGATMVFVCRWST